MIRNCNSMFTKDAMNYFNNSGLAYKDTIFCMKPEYYTILHDAVVFKHDTCEILEKEFIKFNNDKMNLKDMKIFCHECWLYIKQYKCNEKLQNINNDFE